MKDQQFSLKHTAANNKQKLSVKSENTCLKSVQCYASLLLKKQSTSPKALISPHSLIRTVSSECYGNSVKFCKHSKPSCQMPLHFKGIYCEIQQPIKAGNFAINKLLTISCLICCSFKFFLQIRITVFQFWNESPIHCPSVMYVQTFYFCPEAAVSTFAYQDIQPRHL